MRLFCFLILLLTFVSSILVSPRLALVPAVALVRRARLLVVYFFILFSVSEVYANTLQYYPLKHRDPQELQQVISPLLPKGGAISIDNNSLIISAPVADNQRIARLIKRLDRPQKQLQVSVFRGVYPEKEGSYVHSTHTGINQLHKVRVHEGQQVAVTRDTVLKIPVSESVYRQVEDTSSGTEPISGKSTRHELLPVMSGLYFRVSVNQQKQALVVLKAVSQRESPRQYGDNESIQLSQSVETRSEIPLNTWVRLSDDQTFSHRPQLGERRQVSSTKSTSDQQTAVWIKVEVDSS